MRLGIFGGSFDPIHLGHLILAECCRESCQLDKVLFVPAARSPHKLESAPLQDKHRIEMIELAVGGHPNFEVNLSEIKRGGVSYTVDTLTEIKAQFPAAELYFLMGADSLEQFLSWREPNRVCELATLLVVGRPGADHPNVGEVLQGIVTDDRLDAIRKCQITAPLIDLSSTDIRARCQHGQSIRYRVPRAVEEYIRSNGLYRD